MSLMEGYWFKLNNGRVEVNGVVLGASGNVQMAWIGPDDQYQIWRCAGGNAWCSVGESAYVPTEYKLVRIDTADQDASVAARFTPLGCQHATVIKEVSPGKKWREAIGELMILSQRQPTPGVDIEPEECQEEGMTLPEPAPDMDDLEVKKLLIWAQKTFRPGCYLGDLCRQAQADLSEDEVFHLEMAHEGFLAADG